jgi:AcrR family transcriptional regulator
MTLTVIYHGAMGRWEPDAQGRLVEAAMALYVERGFDQTTVAEIAARAGLTERTFFRHFADKREVLFWGASSFQELVVAGVADAPRSATPIEAVVASLEAAATGFQEHSERVRLRQTVIGANPELQERELIKLAALATAMAATLRDRGVKEPAASLAAEAGIVILRIAFERWMGKDHRRPLPVLIRRSLDELRTATAGI